MRNDAVRPIPAKSISGAAFLQRVERAWNERDLVAMLDTYHVDATISKPGFSLIRGRDDIEPWLRQRLDHLHVFELALTLRGTSDDWVCAEYHTTSRSSLGEERSVRGVEYFRLTDAGRISVQRQYNDIVDPYPHTAAREANDPESKLFDGADHD